ACWRTDAEAAKSRRRLNRPAPVGRLPNKTSGSPTAGLSNRTRRAAMHRRTFLAGTLAGTAALGAAPQDKPQAEPPTKGRMTAGHQGRSSDADLRVLAALGVTHICSALPSRTFDDSWSVEGLTKLRERVEGFGVKLDMVPLPLSSSPISRAE